MATPGGIRLLPDAWRRSRRPQTNSFLQCLLFFQIIPFITSFNIDWHYPIIIKAIDEGTGFGGSGSSNAPNYFGASVAFLKPEVGNFSWIIVGAPKANTSQSASSYSEHGDIPEPGAIWQCSLGNSQDICRPVVMDATGNFHDGAIHEWKNESLLGGPNGIALSSKNFVACSSRLERWKDGVGDFGTTLSFMHGNCYVRPRKDLLQAPALASSANSNLLAQNLEHNKPQRLYPLQQKRYEASNENRHGQAGFAVHLPKSGTELVMSAPGLQRWMGSIIQYISRDGGETYTIGVASKPDTCPGTGQGCFQYLGYSLSSGYYFERDVVPEINNAVPVYYAAGAPRANNFRGKVVIFRFPQGAGGTEAPLLVQQEIMGNHTGAYFGSALLSVDLNGDKIDDLVVGSPRFSRQQRPTPRGRDVPSSPLTRGFEPFGGYGDEGAAFIFFSTNGGRGNLVSQVVSLKGGNRPWSQFGTAMTSVGDLNRDGYNDFAVSAPFEDTSGTVYIYHGHKDFIKDVPAQVIRGRQVDPGLRGFGFSLTGSEDIDNNGYNDLAIGSVNSSQTVILRSKPVITVYGAVKSPLSMLPLNTDTFMVEACVSYTGDYAPPSMELQINLEADANVPRRRVSIRNADESDFGNPTTSMEYRQTVKKGEGEICKKFYAAVQDSLESSGASVVFQQRISIPQQKDPIVDARMIHIQTRNGTFYTSGAKFSDFCRTCPMVDAKKESIFELELPLAIPCGEDNICKSDISLDVTFPDVKLTAGRFLVGTAPSVIMEIRLGNSKEPAIQPAVLVTWWKLKLKRNPPDCTKDSEKDTQITYRCSLGKLLVAGEPDKVVQLEFDLESLVVSESGGAMKTELFWNVTALTVSEQAPVSISILLPLSYRADPHIAGSRMMEVFNVNTLWSYIVFTHKFEVNLDGPSPVGDIEAFFQLPVNLTAEPGKGPLFNVRGVKVYTGTGGSPTLVCQATKGQFSTSDEALLITSQDQDPDFDVEGAGFSVLLPKDKDISRGSNSSLVEKDRLLLHCDSHHVVCMEVTCKAQGTHFPGIKTEVTFVIDIASENIRRLMKTHKVSAIQVESFGKLILSSTVKSIQPLPDKADETTAVTLIEREGHKPVSKWIYILAVVLGILIFLCIVYCVYACGCFEEKKPVSEDHVDGGKIDDENPKEKDVDDQEEDGDPSKKPLMADVSRDNDSEEDPRRSQNSLLVPTSPFSDVSDPPDFVPTEPPIPEEREDEIN